MVVINHNIPVLDRKEWQMMTPAPVTTTTGTFLVEDGSSLNDYGLYMTSTTVHYLYSHKEDGWAQIPSGAFAGTFGAGSCGTYSPWSVTYTANGGTTSTITVAAASFSLTAVAINSTVEFLTASSGTQGLRRVITAIDSAAGTGTITLSLDYPVPAAVATGNTFRLTTGRFFVMNAGTIAAGIWKTFDIGTMTWQANLATTGLPATWGTDGKLVWTGRKPSIYADGSATSGSTTTLADTTQNWAVNRWAGYYLVIVSGTGAGQVVQIISNTATTLTFGALTTSPVGGSIYQLRAQPTNSMGVATSGSTTTLVNSAKAWNVNQWTGFQVRIHSGTGIGQIRKITSNTATTLTCATFTTAPDSTSMYEIEPNEDSIYLLGNAAVTMYLYSISGNTWSTVAPTTARAAVASTGLTADFVDITGDPIWGSEVGIQDSRYIYSHRGGASSSLDRFDITGGTSGAGAWAPITIASAETFTVGSSGFQQGRFFYLRKEATQRYFKYDIPGNVLLPFNTDLYPDSTAVVGQKVWIKYLDATGNVQWLYSLGNSSTVLRRIGIV